MYTIYTYMKYHMHNNVVLYYCTSRSHDIVHVVNGGCMYDLQLIQLIYIYYSSYFMVVLYCTRNHEGVGSRTEQHEAQPSAVLQLRDPNSSAVLLVQYRNNHEI